MTGGRLPGGRLRRGGRRGSGDRNLRRRRRPCNDGRRTRNGGSRRGAIRPGGRTGGRKQHTNDGRQQPRKLFHHKHLICRTKSGWEALSEADILQNSGFHAERLDTDMTDDVCPLYHSHQRICNAGYFLSQPADKIPRLDLIRMEQNPWPKRQVAKTRTRRRAALSYDTGPSAMKNSFRSL